MRQAIEFHQEDPLDAACEEYRLAKEHFDQAEQVLKLAQQNLAATLEQYDLKSHKAKNFQFTMVRSERLVFNEDGLRKALGARVFNKLAIRKLDQKKLNEAIVDGVVDPVVVAQFATRKESDPFIRMSKSKS